MAGTTVKQTGSSQPAMDEVRQQLNNLVDDLELLRSHVATGTGVTATAAAALKAAKVAL